MQQEYNIRFALLVSCVATIGGFLFGFDSGVINGTVEGLQTAFDSDSVGTGFNVASMLLGCAAGAFFAGRLADIYGRRTLLMVSAVLFIISAWGSGIAGLFQWGSNFAITMTFPLPLTTIGLTGAYSIYALFAALSVVFVVKFVHETNGLALEEMVA